MTTQESQLHSPTSPGILNSTPRKPTGSPEKVPINALYKPHRSRTSGRRNTKRHSSPSRYSYHKNPSSAAHSTMDEFLESPQTAQPKDSRDGYHRPLKKRTKMGKRRRDGTQSATAPSA